jgi:hypothetical protein
MLRFILLVLVLNGINGFAQNSIPSYSLYPIDTALYKEREYHTIGVNRGVINSIFGIGLSSYLDEQPLIPTNHLTSDYLCKIQLQTDSEKNHSFRTKLALNYSTQIEMVDAEFSEKDFSSINFFHRDINLSLEFDRKVMTEIRFIAKFGFQQLNGSQN